MPPVSALVGSEELVMLVVVVRRKAMMGIGEGTRDEKRVMRDVVAALFSAAVAVGVRTRMSWLGGGRWGVRLEVGEALSGKTRSCVCSDVSVGGLLNGLVL